MIYFCFVFIFSYKTGWMFGKLDGRVGIFPADYVEPMSRIEARKISASSSRHTNQQVRQILFLICLFSFSFCFSPLLSQSIFRLLYPHQPITNKQTSHEWLDDWWISPPNVVCVICLINWKDRKSTKRTNASICSIMPTNSAPLKLAIWSDVVVRATSGHLFSAALLTVSFARAGKKKKKNRERVCC